MAELTEFERSRSEFYDRVFTGIAGDSLVHALFREAFGDEHPEEGIDVFSSWSRGTLTRALAALRLEPGGLLADLGCGLGGPGRWLARETGARLVGVDISQAALDAAAESARAALGPDRAEYRRGSFNDTGLASASVDAAVSADALPFAKDRAGALAELHRVLRPGARAFFTTAEWRGEDPAPSERLLTDWPALITEAGLTLVEAFDGGHSEDRWLTVYPLWLRHEAELRDRLGDAAQALIDEANSGLSNIPAGYVGIEYVVERPEAPAV